MKRCAGFSILSLVFAIIPGAMLLSTDAPGSFSVGKDDKKASRLETAISRAILRLDGFVSADAAYSGGWMTTRPIAFEGERLELNLDTSAGGMAQVEIRDFRGKPILGYTL